jgi:hypothetical protein
MLKSDNSEDKKTTIQHGDRSFDGIHIENLQKNYIAAWLTTK